METIKGNKESLQRAQQKNKSDTISEVTLEIRDLIAELGQMSIAELYKRLLDKVDLFGRVICVERVFNQNEN